MESNCSVILRKSQAESISTTKTAYRQANLLMFSFFMRYCIIVVFRRYQFSCTKLQKTIQTMAIKTEKGRPSESRSRPFKKTKTKKLLLLVCNGCLLNGKTGLVCCNILVKSFNILGGRRNLNACFASKDCVLEEVGKILVLSVVYKI